MPRSVAFGDWLGYFDANMTASVLLAIDGPRATITLNDLAKHNRLDPAGLRLLREAVEKADADPSVRVTVITGAVAQAKGWPTQVKFQSLRVVQALPCPGARTGALLRLSI